MIVTVGKKQVHDAEFGMLIVPDYDLSGKSWQKVSETDDTMTIEILDGQS